MELKFMLVKEWDYALQWKYANSVGLVVPFCFSAFAPNLQ